MSLSYYKKGKSEKILFYKDGIILHSALEYPQGNESGGRLTVPGLYGYPW